MIFSRKFYLIILTLSFITNISVFASGKRESAKPEQLTVSSRLYSQPGEQKFLINEIFPEFEKENNCRILFEIVEDDSLIDRASYQKQSGRITTDVVIVQSGRMAEWMDNGYVIPLPVEEWSDRTFSRVFNENITKGGKSYFAPVGADVYLLLANKKALSYLPEDALVQNLTWEQYVQWAVNIARGEGEGKTAVTGVPMKSLIYMLGGMFLSYGGEFPVINSPGALNAWEVLTDMKQAYSPHINSYDNITYPMTIGESWLTVAHMVRCGEAYRSNPDDFILAPAPRGPEGIGTIAGTSGFGVIKGAPHEDLAIAFIEFMTDPERAVRIARGTGGFIPPIDESIEKLGQSIEDEIIGKGLKVMMDGVISGIPGGDYTLWSDVKKIYDDAFQELILKRGIIDRTYLDEAQARINSLKKSP